MMRISRIYRIYIFFLLIQHVCVYECVDSNMSVLLSFILLRENRVRDEKYKIKKSYTNTLIVCLSAFNLIKSKYFFFLFFLKLKSILTLACN